MRKLIRSVALAAVLALAPAAQAAIVGDVSGGGVFAGSVETNDGWVTEQATGDAVDFWTLTVSESQLLEVSIDSSIDFGLSVYDGVVGDDFAGELAFDNDGDFDGGTYLGGTPSFGASGSELALLLPDAGTYTLAVGGDIGGFGIGPFSYTMTVVPEPGTLWLLGLGMSALALRRGRP
ncbi:MAG: PEP-CTERM sorting domain-containing protein [Proteobacteria bacterium]|nr:PEP-CTERM sorting domain-containing protein [Pseudomonadota bacterium]